MDTSDDDEFFFESSHLALRCNSDYLKTIRHLTVLCKSRIQVNKDIEILTATQKKALQNPSTFVEQLKYGSLDLPAPTVIAEIPSVNFAKYDLNLSNHESTNDKNIPTLTPDKSQTINFWTLEEQRKLEELLHEYPPEAVESQRFVKIAKAMGNRTPKQIASRVQKFFKKLNDANLPIPGSSSHQPFRSRHYKAQKQKFKFEKPSTFFPERNIPSDLMMKNDSDDEPEIITQSDEKSKKILSLLKLVREGKEQNVDSDDSGDKCFICEENLSVGSRWQCDDCISGMNYCADCMTFQLLNSNFEHLDHHMRLC